MAKEHKYGVVSLKRQFPNEAVCMEFLFKVRHSMKCTCGGRYVPLFRMSCGEFTGRQQFQCGKCRYQISPTAGTIFHKSSTPLSLWFHAILVFSNAKSGVSAKQLEREIEVTYKTAYRMNSLIRGALSQNAHRMKGSVEMDVGYFGGRGYAGKNNEDLSRVMKNKSTVIGAYERNGEMRAQVIPNAGADAHKEFLDKNVAKGARLLTDNSRIYKNVVLGYDRHFVDHHNHEFARKDIHVNHVETFWSHVKRSIKGTYKGVSKKHLQEYLDSFVWHYNNRDNDNERFVSLLGTLLRASR